jgi:hypothetical protein
MYYAEGASAAIYMGGFPPGLAQGWRFLKLFKTFMLRLPPANHVMG